MRRRHHAAVAVLVTGLLLAGCSSSERPSATGAQADLRAVVYTADMTVRVADARQAAQRAAEVAAASGGFVFAQTADLEGRRNVRMTLKVLPERLDRALDELAGLGEALSRNLEATDVTDEVVDVDGRLRTAQASVDRLRALLGDARTTADVIVVEAELAKRQSELESLQGRLRVLDSRTDHAMITVRFTEEARPELARGIPGFGPALHAGWIALLSLLAAALAVAGFLVPFSPVLLGAGWVIHRQRRRSPRAVTPPAR